MGFFHKLTDKSDMGVSLVKNLADDSLPKVELGLQGVCTDKLNSKVKVTFLSSLMTAENSQWDANMSLIKWSPYQEVLRFNSKKEPVLSISTIIISHHLDIK